MFIKVSAVENKVNALYELLRWCEQLAINKGNLSRTYNMLSNLSNYFNDLIWNRSNWCHIIGKQNTYSLGFTNL